MGDDPQELLDWVARSAHRELWPRELRDIELHPKRTVPRSIIKAYVTWRRQSVNNARATYRDITGEVIEVLPQSDGTVAARLSDGRVIEGEHAVLASGSISVKIPAYVRPFTDHPRVIIDPLVEEGHARRAEIPRDARVLVLGMGLTAEEQVHVLLQRGHRHVTLLSRSGLRHYTYPRDQIRRRLVVSEPDFIANPPATSDEFIARVVSFFTQHLSMGYSPEDVHAALRPYWDPKIRYILGRCEAAARVLYEHRRMLAVYSIGTSYEVSQCLWAAESDGRLVQARGHVCEIEYVDGVFHVSWVSQREHEPEFFGTYDYIINAVGRDILQHPMWRGLLETGVAHKHAGIGVQVDADGRLRMLRGACHYPFGL